MFFEDGGDYDGPSVFDELFDENTSYDGPSIFYEYTKKNCGYYKWWLWEFIDFDTNFVDHFSTVGSDEFNSPNHEDILMGYY